MDVLLNRRAGLGWAILAGLGGLAFCAWNPPAEAGPPKPGAATAPAPAPAAAPVGPDEPGADAIAVGPALCDTPVCHGGLMKDMEKVPHTRYTNDVKLGDRAGCEVCHGAASDHVGDPDRRKIPRFTEAVNARRVDQACMQCHEKSLPVNHFRSSEHGRAGLGCASCHEVHHDLGTPYLLRFPGEGGPAGRPLEPRKPAKSGKSEKAKPAPAPPPPTAADAEPPAWKPRLATAARTRFPIAGWRSSFSRQPDAVTEQQAINELCASCHRRQAADSRLPSHHPLPEGRVKCTDCHTAHRSDGHGLPGREAMVEKCLRCHEQVRGPFRFEHEPVRESAVGEACLECHRPHGSSNRGLLTQFSRAACVQCHTDIQRDPPHLARTGSCWRAGCHVAVHGSDHSRLLLRQ